MSFEEVLVDRTNMAHNSPECQWVKRVLPRVPVFDYLADRKRGVSWFRISINASEERPPGLCFLFLGGPIPVQVEAYEQAYTSPEGRVMSMKLYSLSVPEDERISEPVVLEMIREAMMASGKKAFSPWVRVEFTFYRGFPNNKPSFKAAQPSLPPDGPASLRSAGRG